MRAGAFVALQSLEIAQENEILLQTIQLFACCLLELIFSLIITLLLLAGLHTQKEQMHPRTHTLPPPRYLLKARNDPSGEVNGPPVASQLRRGTPDIAASWT